MTVRVILDGIPKIAEEVSVYQLTAIVTPVNNPNRLTASKDKIPCNAVINSDLKKCRLLYIAIKTAIIPIIITAITILFNVYHLQFLNNIFFQVLHL